jgi:alanyl-tRNA synthetase
MIGQHTFVSPEEWNQGELFMDMHDFIHKGVGLPKEEITIHEDSWAGGGSFGCSLEFFSRGVELFNQVYTMFEQSPEGPKELKLKVLDMGLGQERVAWFSQGTPNMYEAIYPFVLSKLREITKIELDLDLYNKFSQYSAYLNIDEVDDMDEAWQRVANELNLDVYSLKDTIQPMTGLYSIAEHARSLLFAINDGKLPSNVGGGYNLRAIFRRAISFIDKFNWNIDLADVCEWHAEELKGIFPEVSKKKKLKELRMILNVEKDKFNNTKKKAGKILERILQQGDITTETLIEQYDSNGISPDMVKEAAKKFNVRVEIPDNFYNLVVERHENAEKVYATEKEFELDLEGIPETESLYYYDYTEISNEAKVLKIIDYMVVLDKTVVYPTSGGQKHDIGIINGQNFIDAFKQGNHTVHVMKEKPEFKEENIVKVEVDKSWRTQLSQHHTATHIVNAAARDILGSHINQAGAKKSEKESHLDITHYEQIPREKIIEIEKRANEIVEEAIDLNLSFLPRTEAEQKYGMAIYQGGAVPGKKVRIVEIPDVDVEACGGTHLKTHLNNTSETGYIHITKSQKIQDGIVRLTFTAGNATEILKETHKRILEELKNILKVERKQLVARVLELREKWKAVNKGLQSGNVNEQNIILNSNEEFEGDILSEISQILKIKKEEVPTKIQKYLDEWEANKKKLGQTSSDQIEKLVDNAISFKDYKIVFGSFNNLNNKEFQRISSNVLKRSDILITLFFNETKDKTIVIGMLGKKAKLDGEIDMGNVISQSLIKLGGGGGGRKDYGSGSVDKSKASRETLEKEIREKLFRYG